MKLAEKDRFDPSQMSPSEISQLSEFFFTEDKPALIGREGVQIPLPDPVFHLLVRVVNAMREGQSVLIFPEEECLTTQAAANLLGVSRPFLVELLERDEIPHHKTGTHRRVFLKDLIAYQKRRDAERRRTMDELTARLEAAGIYERTPPPEGDAR
jgi:excisionase family DNA binding protein